MKTLESWLNQATRHLAADSAAQVRTEIREHFESAREAAIAGGATATDADQIALSTLGDPKIANRQYRRVLLTAAEARMLRQSSCEARALRSRLWLKWYRSPFLFSRFPRPPPCGSAATPLPVTLSSSASD